jgi:hypothetical protein
LKRPHISSIGNVFKIFEKASDFLLKSRNYFKSRTLIIKSLHFSENVFKKPNNRSKCLTKLGKASHHFKKASITLKMFCEMKPRNFWKTQTLINIWIFERIFKRSCVFSQRVPFLSCCCEVLRVDTLLFQCVFRQHFCWFYYFYCFISSTLMWVLHKIHLYLQVYFKSTFFAHRVANERSTICRWNSSWTQMHLTSSWCSRNLFLNLKTNTRDLLNSPTGFCFPNIFGYLNLYSESSHHRKVMQNFPFS